MFLSGTFSSTSSLTICTHVQVLLFAFLHETAFISSSLSLRVNDYRFTFSVIRSASFTFVKEKMFIWTCRKYAESKSSPCFPHGLQLLWQYERVIYMYLEIRRFPSLWLGYCFQIELPVKVLWVQCRGKVNPRKHIVQIHPWESNNQNWFKRVEKG